MDDPRKPTANVTKAVDFDSHVYSNNAVMGSTNDINFNLLDKFNKSYSSDRTRDGGAMSFMGLSQLDASRTAKVGGSSKFTSRRDYQEAMAPRATSEETSESDDAYQTRPPVLRLRGAGLRQRQQVPGRPLRSGHLRMRVRAGDGR